MKWKTKQKDALCLFFFFFFVPLLHWTLSLLVTSNFPKYPIFHVGVGLWIYSTTDFSNYCTWEVLIFTPCLLTNMIWLCFNLKSQSGNRTGTPSPATPESVTGTLSTYINPTLTQIRWGCFNITTAVLMKEEPDVLMRRQIISHGFCRNQGTLLILMDYFISVLISSSSLSHLIY